ncbi:MAG: acetyltransferase [Candidatus Solibacter usitatus]|nr:acetyltransferase [Candidatus Solibacter usitatus]
MIGWWRKAGTLLMAGVAILAISLPSPCQSLVSSSTQGGPVRMLNTDMAVMEMQEPRKDLPCTVTPAKAVLGFDLKFHAGYDVSIPMKELSGSENMLTILFRVIPEKKKDDPVYLTQRVRVPSIEEDAKGDAVLHGTFDVGEGKYHVDWLIRDRSERVCSFYWDSDAQLPSKDKGIAVEIPAETVQATEFEQFREESPVERRTDDGQINVKVLVNFAPQNPRSATLQPVDTSALVSILRTISRNPRISRFTLVAFNLQEQRVVYRQEEADRIDFPKLGDALRTLKLGTVDVKKLGQKRADTEFLTDLIQKEAGPEKHPDALIFAGPKAILDANVPTDALREVGDPGYPVFYLNYNLNPQYMPWRDSIGHAVKFFKGVEYTISRPRDVWFSISEVVSRIVKSKQGRQHQAAATGN